MLEEEAFQWWDSFDQLGESKAGTRQPSPDLLLIRSFTRTAVIPNPNPSKTLALLTKVLDHLTSPSPSGCAWHPSQIHLFGFAQGGSCAGELALLWSRSHPPAEHLGSLVSISGPLLSHPTVSAPAKTAMCLAHRAGEERAMGVPSWRKGFQTAQEVKLPGGRGREGMPRGMDEWREIMRQVLRHSPSDAGVSADPAATGSGPKDWSASRLSSSREMSTKSRAGSQQPSKPGRNPLREASDLAQLEPGLGLERCQAALREI